MKTHIYETPQSELLEIVMEQTILSGGNGTSEPIGYDDDPLGGGN